MDNPATPDRIDGCPIEGTDPSDPKEDRCDFEAGHKDSSCIDEELCGATTVTDAYTVDLAVMVANELELLLAGDRPHLVLCLLDRYFLF